MACKPSIEELALKHLNRHPNDKSDSILAKMRGSFGRKKTEEAIKNMHYVLCMTQPNKFRITCWPDDFSDRWWE